MPRHSLLSLLHTGSLLAFISGRAALAYPHEAGNEAVYNGVDHTHKYCKLFYSVTYHDMWGPLFVEDSYKCDFTAQYSSESVMSVGEKGQDGGVYTDVEPVLQSRRFIKSHRHKARYEDNDDDDDNAEKISSSLPKDKHQIINFGCLPLPDAELIDITRDSTLLAVLPEITNQSCLPPDHLREYREYPRSWMAHWAFTNINRGKETICDWYSELSMVAKALNLYCESSFERHSDGESLREVLAYGRDREREATGGQRWCLRYSDKGWGYPGFDEKCLGVGGDVEEEEVVEEFGEIEL